MTYPNEPTNAFCGVNEDFQGKCTNWVNGNCIDNKTPTNEQCVRRVVLHELAIQKIDEQPWMDFTEV